MIKYICKICDKKFHSSSKNRKTCSVECGNKWKSVIKKGKSPKNVNDWIEKGKETRFAKGCKATNKKNIKKKKLKILYTNRELTMKEIAEIENCSPATICSYLEKYSIEKRPKGFQRNNKVQKGWRHWNWKGGITEFYNSIRGLQKMVEWRGDIFHRDNYSCQACNDGGRIVAHHIIEFEKIIKRHDIKTIKDAKKCKTLWNIKNGMTLCEDCHKFVHS